MKKILLVLFLFPQVIFAEHSLRRCMLLPIIDDFQGALSFRVFESIENYLKDSTWCYYKHNSSVINVLSEHSQGLSFHLQNPEVIKTISNKVKAGSIIKIRLNKLNPGIEVKMSVIGANGRDVYFSENSNSSSNNIDEVSNIIKNWLEVYSKQIPYDGVVIGVLGDQFTVDVGKSYLARTGKRIEVIRVTKKKKHPLLKEVVEWDFHVVASGKLFNASDYQSQGIVTTYYSKGKLKKGDYVRITDPDSRVDVKDEQFPDVKEYQFGTLGDFTLQGILGKGSSGNAESGGKGYAGFKYGINLEGTVFGTRNYWGGLRLGRSFGSYSKDEGSLSSNDSSSTTGIFQIKGAYRYLPLGFFYGPRIDGYIGYAKYSYGMDTNTVDKFGDASFSGIMLGVNANVPLRTNYRIGLGLDFLLGADYQEDVTIFGDAESATSIRGDTEISYKYAPNILFVGNLEYLYNKAKFTNSNSEYRFSDIQLRFGARFNY